MNTNTHNLLWEPYIEAARESWWQGDYEKAGKILVKAMQEAEDYGEVDPCLVRSVENLSRLYFNKRQFAQAEWLQMQAFETMEKLLGPDHPEVVRCFDKLAEIIEEWERDGGVVGACRNRENWGLLVIEEDISERGGHTYQDKVALPMRTGNMERFFGYCRTLAAGLAVRYCP